MSQLLSKISKIFSVILGASMWGLCVPNFRPLASLIWEENELTDACGRHADPYTKFLNSTHFALGRKRHFIWLCRFLSIILTTSKGNLVFLERSMTPVWKSANIFRLDCCYFTNRFSISFFYQ